MTRTWRAVEDAQVEGDVGKRSRLSRVANPLLSGPRRLLARISSRGDFVSSERSSAVAECCSEQKAEVWKQETERGMHELQIHSQRGHDVTNPDVNKP